MRSTKLLFCCLVWGLVLLQPALVRAQDQAQALPMSIQALEDMDDFVPVAGNWRIVGDATADRHTDAQITISEGQGVLVNIPSAQARENLTFDWEHGDIDLELEFMMPKGSNAGIYLQGRYEIQMFDSWGVSRPTFSDAGGIYQRWDPDRPTGREGYQGHPPRLNVSRAPGLWQRFRIRFQAPRFDDDGRKIANAKMIEVVHNGVVIHENVELTGPTRGAAFSDEQSMGPIMIQGDHGPVALREIRYKSYRQDVVSLTDVHYRLAEGDFDRLPDLATQVPQAEADVQGIDWRVIEPEDRFVSGFTGTLQVPYTDLYRFQLQLDWTDGPDAEDGAFGAGALVIGGQTVVDHTGAQQTVAGDVQLSAGAHPFALSFYKNRRNAPPRMALYAEGGGMPLRALSAPATVPTAPRAGPIFVEPMGEPVLIRGFVRHGGQKKTHTIAVGHPGGVHYTMDLQQGALLHAWKGAFVETTAMWQGRGQEQLAVPQGSVLTFSGQPAVARLASSGAAWPDGMGANYAFEGYELDSDGHPSFLYRLGDVSSSDRLLADEGGRQLIREVTLRAEADPEGYWVRVATGRDIRELPEGGYAVDGTYYVTLNDSGDARAVLRATGDGQELLIPFSFDGGLATVRYALVW